MTSPQLMAAGLSEIGSALGTAVTRANSAEQPFTALVAELDQIRGFISSMAAALRDEPAPVLVCAACVQEARNAEAAGRVPQPVHSATTVINGLAVCDVEGRHRIVTAVQHQAAQSGRLLLPGSGPLPPLGGGR